MINSSSGIDYFCNIVVFEDAFVGDNDKRRIERRFIFEFRFTINSSILLLHDKDKFELLADNNEHGGDEEDDSSKAIDL